MKKWIMCFAVAMHIFLFSTEISGEYMECHSFYEVLQQFNVSFFASRELRIDFLKNCPHVIPTLAQWMYDAWSPYDVSLTQEKLIHSFSERLHDDRLPITCVVLRGEVPVGIVSLRERSDVEFSDFPEHSLWGGSLLVAPEARNQGIGEALGKVILALGKCLKYGEIYFYTSNPHFSWYTKRGAQMIEARPFHGHTITIFRMLIP